MASLCKNIPWLFRCVQLSWYLFENNNNSCPYHGFLSFLNYVTYTFLCTKLYRHFLETEYLFMYTESNRRAPVPYRKRPQNFFDRIYCWLVFYEPLTSLTARLLLCKHVGIGLSRWSGLQSGAVISCRSLLIYETFVSPSG